MRKNIKIKNEFARNTPGVVAFNEFEIAAVLSIPSRVRVIACASKNTY